MKIAEWRTQDKPIGYRLRRITLIRESNFKIRISHKYYTKDPYRRMSYAHNKTYSLNIDQYRELCAKLGSPIFVGENIKIYTRGES
jgi:hypothetical protein